MRDVLEQRQGRISRRALCYKNIDLSSRCVRILIFKISPSIGTN